MQEKASRLGCGFAECDGIKTYVCNYNYEAYSFDYLYDMNGGSCSKCPHHCDENNLCG